jgi:hypothetical protein
MNTSEAIEFLENNQPLPPDYYLGEKIKVYDDVRAHFKANCDERCVILLLNSFGEGNGFGVYQLVEDTLKFYPLTIVASAINSALISDYRSVRYWSAQLAAVFPNEGAIENLSHLLLEDFDMRYAVITALVVLKTKSALDILEAHLGNEREEELKDLISSHLSTG